MVLIKVKCFVGKGKQKALGKEKEPFFHTVFILINHCPLRKANNSHLQLAPPRKSGQEGFAGLSLQAEQEAEM